MYREESGSFDPWSGSYALTCLMIKKPKRETEAILQQIQ